MDKNARKNVSIAIQCGKRGAREHRQYTAVHLWGYVHLKRVDKNARTNVSIAIQCVKRGAREHRQYTAEYMCKYQYISCFINSSSISWCYGSLLISYLNIECIIIDIY